MTDDVDLVRGGLDVIRRLEARVAELEAALDRIAYFRYGNETTAGEIARDVLKGADPDIVPVRATPVDEKGREAK